MAPTFHQRHASNILSWAIAIKACMGGLRAMELSKMAKKGVYQSYCKFGAVASILAFFQNSQVLETKNYLNINYCLPTFASKSHFGGQNSSETWKTGNFGEYQVSLFGCCGFNFGIFSNPSSPRDQKLPKYYLLFTNICLQKSFLGWKKLINMKNWKFGKEENFLSQLGNGHFTTFLGSNNFSKSKCIWGDGESWIWTNWTPKKALTDIKMSRKWPNLLFQLLEPPGGQGGFKVEKKSWQPFNL